MTAPQDLALTLIEDYVRAETECFGPWCALLDARRQPEPGAVVASQSPLHQAAGRLRDWCLANQAAAEARRQQLMIDQVKGELAATAAVAAQRGGQAREQIRRDWITARLHIIQQRDALTCGLGWPHRGEPVSVRTSHYDRTGTEVAEAGDGIYLNGYDVYEVGHQVWLPDLSPRHREATLLVSWSPCTGDWRLGPADPIGDIGLRLCAAPSRRLPVPLQRWPEPADVGIEVEQPAPPLALFDAAEVPGLAGAAPRRSSLPRPRHAPPPATANEGTLF